MATKCLFEKNLQLSHSKIKAQRAALIAEDARDAAVEKIRTLNKDKRDLSKKLMGLEDLSPSSTMSLKVGSDDFNGEKWFEEMYEIELQLVEIEVKLKTANSIKDKYFTVNAE